MGVVLLGYGNPSRGDDALGPLLLDRVRRWVEERPGAGVEAVEDFQLQIEHVLDIAGHAAVVFVDAHVSCPPPFCFARVAAAEDASYTTHELSPAALLHVYRQTVGGEPPPAYVLSVRGERFELGEPLSAAARSHLEGAWTFLRELLERGVDALPAATG
jgi:hydrogenase maturation protease